jgi:hypothetical protein
MGSSSQPDVLIHYSQAIGNVIAAGDKVVDWLPRDQQYKSHAFDKLVEAVDELRLHTDKLEQPFSAPCDLFFEAAVQMQAGYLLIEAGRGIESGNNSGIHSALDNLRAEEMASAGGEVTAQMFEADLLLSPVEGMNDQSALDEFKSRAARTLDNMVTEAHEVLSSALDKFKDTFDEFYEALGKLVNSFSAREGADAIRTGVEKVLSSLNMVAGLLQNERIQQTIESLKEMVHGFDLQQLLAKTFGCRGTKEAIDSVKLSPTVNRATLNAAGARMAELSRQYVLLLKQVRRVLNVVGAVGGILLLTGVAAHYAGPALPVAYAVITLATVLIGMTFADARMRGLISSL